MGAIPTYSGEKNGATLDSVVAIGSYVGFDNNKPLKSGRTRIAGASGGLPQWAAFAKEEIEIMGTPKKVDFLDISVLAAGEVPLQLGNERGELVVDPMTGMTLAGASAEAGRPLPWIDIPGYTPPQVQEMAAESAAESGIMVSLPMPAAEQPEASTAPAEVAASDSTSAQAPATEATAAAEPAPHAPSVTPAPAAAAMPKDDDWDLPEGFNGNNAFVPIEAE